MSRTTVSTMFGLLCGLGLLFGNPVAKAGSEASNFVCEWSSRATVPESHHSVSFRFFPRDLGYLGYQSVWTDGYVLGPRGGLRPFNFSFELKTLDGHLLFTTSESVHIAKLFHPDAVALRGSLPDELLNYRAPGKSEAVKGKVALLGPRGRTLSLIEANCYRLNQEDFSAPVRSSRK